MLYKDVAHALNFELPEQLRKIVNYLPVKGHCIELIVAMLDVNLHPIFAVADEPAR